MMLAERLRSRRPGGTPASPGRRAIDAPVTLSGPVLRVARIVWSVMALAALLLGMAEAPFLYHAALQLHNTTGVTTLSPAQWRLGLQRLGLSPALYAALAVGVLYVMTGTMFVSGLLIFARRSHELMALLVSYVFVTLGVGIITAYAGGPALVTAHPALRGLLKGYTALADLGWGTLFLIPLLFPDGRFVPRWTRWPAAFFFVPTLVPAGSALDYTQWPAWIAIPLTLLWDGTLLFAPLYRYWRVSDVTQRQQTKWVLFGLVVALGLFLSAGAAPSHVQGLTATPERAVLVALVGSTLTVLGFTVLPLCFVIAILRYRLWDIDLILNRALVYATLTASVVGLYILVVGGLGSLVQTPGQGALSLLATALVALLFHPLRVRLQRGVNRLLYGDRDEPYTVISRLGRQLEGTLAPEAVLPAVVQTVAGALKLPYAAITVQPEPGTPQTGGGTGQPEAWGGVVAAVGEPGGRLLRLPLAYHGEALGELVFSPRSGEETFSAADRRLLEDLARQAGVAASAVRLTAALQRSRERLVTAREEERRRLRRDLHDGLGPALASVTLMADAARNLLVRDPGAAEAVLANLKAEAQAATAEVRRVVYELRPPALDELGLVPAVREQAAQYGQRGLCVQVVAPDALPFLPAAVEVAAYRIALEALTNVLRHADARTCTVMLALDDDGLRLEIADDGRGLNGARAGVGRTAMRERAEELGGWCAVEPGQVGGTRVRVHLPLSAPIQGGAG